MDLAKSLIVCLFTAFCPDPSRHYFGRNLGNYLNFAQTNGNMLEGENGSQPGLGVLGKGIG